MRIKFTRIWCVALLYAFAHLFSVGCSSSKQEEDGDLEASEQGNQAEEGGEEGNEEGANEEGVEGEENTAQANNEEGINEEGNGEEGDDVANVGNEEQGAEGEMNSEQTNRELEDIIASQNGNTGNAAANVGNAAPAVPEEAAVEEAPATETAEAAPAEAAPVAKASPALPEMGSKMPYIVRSGETLAKIATKVYGKADKWNEMAELTSLRNANRVRPGDVVYYRLSEETLAFASAYEATPRVEMKIQTGDSLSGIAQRVYGSPLDWKSIWRQNDNIMNPDSLEVGQTISYLSPENLSAALKYAKSLKLADLIKTNYEKADPVSKTTTVETNTTGMTGFEIAKNMFDAFAG